MIFLTYTFNAKARAGGWGSINEIVSVGVSLLFDIPEPAPYS